MRDSRAGRPMLVSESSLDVDSESLLSVNVGDAGEAGRRGLFVLSGRSAWARVVTRTLRDEGFWAGEPVGSRERFSFVDRMPERDAVMRPRAVAGLCGCLRLSTLAVRDG